MTESPRIPVSLLTGFLGSGKTTLLRHLIRHPDMARTACVINEFGEVGLDDALVRTSDESVVMMESGCLCCTIRSDLADTLYDLFVGRAEGRHDFDRVVIETTGLADPAPILQTLLTDGFIASRYRLDSVVATVDAVHGSGQLDDHPEPSKQAAVADRLVITKTDLADAETVAALEARLARLNPAAPRIRAVDGAIEPDRLFEAGLFDPARKTVDVQRWLNEAAYEDDHEDHHDHHHAHGHGHGHGHRHDPNRHDARIAAFCLRLEQPVSWGAIAEALDRLAEDHGERLLRVKGLLQLTDTDKPVVVHGVQHMFHPPAVIDAWPPDGPGTRIVFITRDLDRDTVEALLRTSLGLPPAAPAAGGAHAHP